MIPQPTWRIIPGLGYVVNNHGDVSLQDLGLFNNPFQMAELHGLYINGDDPDYLPTGMILQVPKKQMVIYTPKN